MEFIANAFQNPLEAVSINLLILQDQIVEVVEYARLYLSIDKEDYHKVWYKLHNCLIFQEILSSFVNRVLVCHFQMATLRGCFLC